MIRARTTTVATVHQLKVTLRNLRPPIWRRIQVPSDITLGDLHEVIQAAMGWSGGHLHQFVAGGDYFGDSSLLDDVQCEKRTRLAQVAPSKGNKLRYEYDFGDGWDHEIVVEAVVPAEAESRVPVCLAGRRAGPPEDCGGVWGYADLIEIMANPEHEEHAEMREWLGRPLDPEAFDVAEVNRRLSGFHRRSRRSVG